MAFVGDASPILEQSELPINDPYNQIAATTLSKVPESTSQPTNDSCDQIAPTSPLKTPESTSQPLPIKVFPEMSLSVQVEKGGSKRWLIAGIADWAIGYGNRAVLKDGTVLLAVKLNGKTYFLVLKDSYLPIWRLSVSYAFKLRRKML